MSMTDFDQWLRETYDGLVDLELDSEVPTGFALHAALARACVGLILCEVDSPRAMEANGDTEVSFEVESEAFKAIIREMAVRGIIK